MAAGFQVGVFIDPAVAHELDFFRGVARYAETHRWRIVVGEEILSLSRPALKQWAGKGVIGFLRDAAFVAALRRALIPAVNTSRAGVGLGIPSVIPDTVSAGRMAAQYFLERGFRHFAYCVEGHYAYPDTKLRGFSERLTEVGLSCSIIPQPIALPKNRTWAHHRATLIRQLRQLPKPVAVWARMDHIAARVVGACEAGDIRVPEDIAVMGYGDEKTICPYTRPQLSSIDIAFEGIGFRAAQLLERLMDGDENVPETLLMSPRTVVERGSSDVMAQLDPELAKAVAYIERHACDPAWVADVLRYMGMKRRRLERLFQQHLHRSPNTEIVRVRIRRAQRLLTKTNTPLAEVAKACGFASSNSFIGTFKRITGSTPRAFRVNPK